MSLESQEDSVEEDPIRMTVAQQLELALQMSLRNREPITKIFMRLKYSFHSAALKQIVVKVAGKMIY